MNSYFNIHVRSRRLRKDGTYNVDYTERIAVDQHEEILRIVSDRTRAGLIVTITDAHEDELEESLSS